MTEHEDEDGLGAARAVGSGCLIILVLVLLVLLLVLATAKPTHADRWWDEEPPVPTVVIDSPPAASVPALVSPLQSPLAPVCPPGAVCE